MPKATSSKPEAISSIPELKGSAITLPHLFLKRIIFLFNSINQGMRTLYYKGSVVGRVAAKGGTSATALSTFNTLSTLTTFRTIRGNGNNAIALVRRGVTTLLDRCMPIKKRYNGNIGVGNILVSNDVVSRLVLSLVIIFVCFGASAQPLNFSFRVSHHNYDAYNRVYQESSMPLNSTTSDVEFTEVGFDAKWAISYTVTREEGAPSGQDGTLHTLKLKLLKGTSAQAALHFDVNIPWQAKGYLLMPAAAYNGNRFDYRRLSYSPKLLDPRDIGADKPALVSDIPKLDAGQGVSRIQDRSGSMAAPVIGTNLNNRSNLFYFQQGNYLGDYGIDVEENRNRSNLRLSIGSPCVRELYKYRIADNRQPTEDKAHDFVAGDSLELKLWIREYGSSNLDNLFSQFLNTRKDFYAPVRTMPQPSLSSCFAVQEKKYNNQNWVPKFHYYSVGMRENFLQDWQIGWTGGQINTYPLLMLGADSTRARVLQQYDWLFPAGIAPSGYFYDSGEKGNIWYGGDIRKPTSKNWHLTRKSADGLYFTLKQFMLLKQRGIAIKPTWNDALKRVADAFVKTWQLDHQWGQFVDSETGRVAVGGSASAALAPAALALAAQWYNNPSYLAVAQEGAQYFHTNYTAKGITTGGPGDALQNADSESCYALLESYIELYEATKDKKYLDYGTQMLAQFSTWVSSYDYIFPPKSLFGQVQMHSTGAVWANTQNKHGAPGICTHSGNALLKLYRYTGNEQATQLLADITTHMPQYIGHPSRPIGKVKDGWVCERVSTTDWLEGIGEITYQSTWAEIALMLTHAEIPSVYIDLANAKAIAFDQVMARVTKSSKTSVTVEIANPTQLPATYTILPESKTAKATSLGHNYLTKAQRITLKSGESKTLTFKR